MKTFLIKIVVFFGIIAGSLAALYTFADPENSTIGDIRYVKTRSLLTNPQKFDALIIGSSRVFDVGNDSSCSYHLFNYGVIQGMPKDYPEFISFARKNQPLRKVLIGLDFFGSSVHGLNDFTSSWQKSSTYIHEASHETAWDIFISYFNFPRLKRLVNYKLFAHNPFQRNAAAEKPGESTTWNSPTLPLYESAYIHYSFDTELGSTYQKIKESCGSVEAIAYITPESAPLIQLMIDKNLRKDYDHFLRTAVKSFGKVYNFMEVNPFTSSPQHFKDENHLRNAYLQQLVCQLLNTPDQYAIPYTLLTEENIEQYLSGEPVGKKEN